MRVASTVTDELPDKVDEDEVVRVTLTDAVALTHRLLPGVAVTVLVEESTADREPDRETETDRVRKTDRDGEPDKEGDELSDEVDDADILTENVGDVVVDTDADVLPEPETARLSLTVNECEVDPVRDSVGVGLGEWLVDGEPLVEFDARGDHDEDRVGNDASADGLTVIFADALVHPDADGEPDDDVDTEADADGLLEGDLVTRTDLDPDSVILALRLALKLPETDGVTESEREGRVEEDEHAVTVDERVKTTLPEEVGETETDDDCDLEIVGDGVAEVEPDSEREMMEVPVVSTLRVVEMEEQGEGVDDGEPDIDFDTA